MAKLKVYVASIGFFDMAVAAPSMKAAAELWNANIDIFKRGGATQTDDPKIVDAALAEPGVVLRRGVGSTGSYTKNASLPKAPKPRKESSPHREVANSNVSAKADETARQAKEIRRAKAEEQARKREADQRERERKRREKARNAADAALERARSRYEKAAAELAERRRELVESEQRERELWEAAQRKHRATLEGLD